MFENFFSNEPAPSDLDLLPAFPIDEVDEEQVDEKYPDIMPLLVVRNTVFFPGLIIPITIGRDKSIKAINHAYDSNRLIAVISQKDSKIEDPTFDDLYKVGTLSKIVKLLRLPDGSITAILQGRKRFKLENLVQEKPFLKGTISHLVYNQSEDKMNMKAAISSIRDMAKQIISLSPSIPSDANIMLNNISSDTFLLNFITSNLSCEMSIKQSILEIDDVDKKAGALLSQMNDELQLLKLKSQIESKVRTDLEKQQRDYFLNQQLKTIQEELGDNPQSETANGLAAKAEKKKWSKDVKEVFDKELEKLKRINPQVAEYTVTLNYLELLLDLPWDDYTKDNFDLKKVMSVLDSDHFGLEKVKDRILEHLAVLKLKGDMKAPIICLVGPPGVGKTSLGKSIANAINRKFIRMSLGGIHDESEIRGHRRTYIGAMPGRILKSLKKVKSGNPVFILDEIDKIGSDHKGDPSSALLEVLDPEQNSTFHDNYLEVDYDLSKILFIATANSLSTIQPALLDRMEIINISGYSTDEKIEIANKHLVAKQRKQHGLKKSHVKIGKPVIRAVIEQYTKESGVRGLDRKIAGLMRHVAKRIAMDEEAVVKIEKDNLKDILGPSIFSISELSGKNVAGVAVGLAWTSVGGDILFIESSINPGKGKLTLTGNLGKVMKESATTALSFIKANAEKIGIDIEVLEENDIHIHVPAGAIPKDGPSAGITMMSSLVSALKKKALKPNFALTGEITLRGKVLPVGGIKEKILAAKRAGIKDIILCIENKKNIEEISPAYLKGIEFHYVENMLDVLELVF